MGRITADPGAVASYEEHLVHTAEGRRLDGLRIVVDCANGAASEHRAAGAGRARRQRHGHLHDAPDGANINERCGSTDPTELSLAVVAHQADLGLAFDGDADRVIAVDHTGLVVDGDVLLALFALDLAERGRLARNTVAVTVMTNLGFRLAMEERGIDVRETDVGDRHVLAALDADGLSLGGEQSGHIIFRSLSTTGDGILTGIALADLVARVGPLAGRPLGRAGGAGAPAPRQRAHPPARAPGRLRRGVGGRGARPRPSSATRAGCSCARAGPSRSCASWSRRGPRPRPMRWRRSSPASWRPPSGRSSRRPRRRPR